MLKNVNVVTPTDEEDWYLGLLDSPMETRNERFEEFMDVVTGNDFRGFKMIYYNVIIGSGQEPTATVKLSDGKEELLASASGNGPLDAMFNALNKAADINVRLVEYVLRAIGPGKGAKGHATLALEIEGERYSGKGSSTDVVEASALAYLNAINLYLEGNKLKHWEPFSTIDREWPGEEVI